MASDVTAAEPPMAAFAGRTIVITGGGGYIAAALLRCLSVTDCIVRRVVRRTSPIPAGGIARIEDVIGDLGERSLWRDVVAGADVVVHLAAQTSTYVANADPAADLRVNVVPVVHLLEACRARGGPVPAVLLAGSATEVGLTTAVPVGVHEPDRPVTIYDLHKLVAEQYLEHYARLGIVRGVCLRLANVYGPGPASSSGDRGILNLMMRRALRAEQLTVYGDGAWVRDYVHVDDVARAFMAAAIHADAISGQHFVIGSGVGTRIVDALELVASRVAARTGVRARVSHVPAPVDLSPIERRHFVADTTRFRAATGWQPRFDLAAGIDGTLGAFLEEADAGR